MIWSVIPEEVWSAQSQIATSYQKVSYLHKQVLAEKRPDGSMRLVCLLSGDPRDFLDERFNPGTIF